MAVFDISRMGDDPLIALGSQQRGGLDFCVSDTPMERPLPLTTADMHGTHSTR